MESTIAKIEGKIALGEKVTVLYQDKSRASILCQGECVCSLRANGLDGEMHWGLFKGERTYSLSKQPDGSVEFSMREIFSGLMAPLIAKSIPDLQPSFNEFAAALKRRAEEVA